MSTYGTDPEVTMSQRFHRLAGSAVLALALALFTVNAGAHHSAANFDFTKAVTIEGKVKSFRVVNPHTHALIEVTDRKGTRDVDYEGHSASNFYRAGYTKDAVSVGDKISISIAPRRDGEDGGFITSFTTAKGLFVGFGGLAPSTGKPEAKEAAGAPPTK